MLELRFLRPESLISIFCYKRDSADTCRCQVMASYQSDFRFEHFRTIEETANFVAELETRELKPGEAKWEFNVIWPETFFGSENIKEAYKLVLGCSPEEKSILMEELNNAKQDELEETFHILLNQKIKQIIENHNQEKAAKELLKYNMENSRLEELERKQLAALKEKYKD